MVMRGYLPGEILNPMQNTAAARQAQIGADASMFGARQSAKSAIQSARIGAEQAAADRDFQRWALQRQLASDRRNRLFDAKFKVGLLDALGVKGLLNNFTGGSAKGGTARFDWNPAGRVDTTPGSGGTSGGSTETSSLGDALSSLLGGGGGRGGRPRPRPRPKKQNNPPSSLGFTPFLTNAMPPPQRDKNRKPQVGANPMGHRPRGR